MRRFIDFSIEPDCTCSGLKCIVKMLSASIALIVVPIILLLSGVLYLVATPIAFVLGLFGSSRFLSRSAIFFESFLKAFLLIPIVVYASAATILCSIKKICGGEKMAKKVVKKVPVEVYSRVVGYFRPVQHWNEGKQQEFKDRKYFDKTLKSEQNRQTA